jgi:branched-chain amino acid transport system permease protein
MSFKRSTLILFLFIAIISITALIIIQSNNNEGTQPVKNSLNISLPINEQTLINISVMVIFCIGFTFTYMIEGFPNFAHTSYAVIGSMISFYLTSFLKINPYYTWIFATAFGGFIGIILYIFIVKPIKRQGSYQDITLTLTFLVIALVIPSIASIFNFWARFYGDVPTRDYNLRIYDFNFSGISGIAIISPVTCIMLILFLHYFLTGSKIGISLRATAENESLAATLGIDTFRAHITSWFISGALAALAGSIMTIRGRMGLTGTDDMIISIMSGSILGGTSNIYGAIIGGLFVALGEDILKNIAFAFFGLPALRWQGLFPIFFLVFSMTIFPNGLLNGIGSNLLRIRTNFDRFFGKN